MSYRLRVSPGREGSVNGTLRRREGDDFRLQGLFAIEWELPTAKPLLEAARRLLAPWEECEVSLSIRWHRRDGASYPWVPRWRLVRTSASRPLAVSEVQGVLHFPSAGE